MRAQDLLPDKSQEEVYEWMKDNDCVYVNNHIVKAAVVRTLDVPAVNKQLNSIILNRLKNETLSAEDVRFLNDLN